MRKILPVLTIAAISLYASGCGDDAPAVATVEVTPRAVRLGYPEVQNVHLSWQASAPLEGVSAQPMVFLHLRDDKDQVVRTYDHPFPQKWREGGGPVAYDARIFQSLLAPPLPPGKYKLTLGLYEGKTRWPLDGIGDKVDKREYAAADVEVPAGAAGPGFAFSPSWLQVEPGGDRYVLARRWLNGRGVIGLKDVKEAGALWLLLRIPSGKEPNETLAVEGGGVPRVLVRGTCGGTETSLSGPGMHELEVPVEAPANGVCRIALLPNFTLTSSVTGQQRSVSLENAAWAPAPASAARPAPASTPGAP
jgi:hypothetical protein